jgi:hypothetical protein
MRKEISFSRQRFRQCYIEMRVSSWPIYMRISVTDVWMYETDEALEEYISLGNDDADMWLSSQNVGAAAGDTGIATKSIKVKLICTLNFQESRVFWDRSSYISVNVQEIMSLRHLILPAPQHEDGGNRYVLTFRANAFFVSVPWSRR